MYFKHATSLQDIHKWFDAQLLAIHRIEKLGLDIEIKPHKQQRSNNQNRFLMVVLGAIVKFYHETGFMPSKCNQWDMDVDTLKRYWKNRWGIEYSHKLDPKEFGEFIDFIQQTMVEETGGEYEILTTDNAYLRSLGEL